MYYLESNSTKYSIIHTLGKFSQRNEQNNVNMVNVMNKFAQCNEQKVWKTGHRNMQIIGKTLCILAEIWRIFGGYLADILERINGKIWWILPKVGKKYGGSFGYT